MANCRLADPSAHLSVPLTPADCDGVFITHRAHGISQCTLLIGVDCSVSSLLFSVCSFLHSCMKHLPWSIVGPLFMFGWGGSPSVISLAHTNHAREREDLLTLKIHVGNE